MKKLKGRGKVYGLSKALYSDGVGGCMWVEWVYVRVGMGMVDEDGYIGVDEGGLRLLVRVG